MSHMYFASDFYIPDLERNRIVHVLYKNQKGKGFNISLTFYLTNNSPEFFNCLILLRLLLPINIDCCKYALALKALTD